MTTKAVEDYTGREFIITRTFDAPRELVFQAWTDPQHLAQWWGPRGFTNPVCEWDVRVGGKIYDVMRAPNGMDFPMGGEFREITPPERLVFMCGALNEKGEMMFEFLHTAVFTDQKGKTLLTLNSRVLTVTAEANKYIGGFEAGMTSSLEKLTELLAPKATAAARAKTASPDDRAVVITRTFDAPRELVWRAWTEPKMMAQWWGPRGFTNPVCEMDVQPGGIWRVVMRSPEGEEFPLKSTFVKVEPPERLVLVMDCSEHPVEWHDLVNPNRDKSQKPRLECVQIITFEDLGGKTKLTIRTELETCAIRDAMVKMGMHEGWSGSLDRLAQCLAQTA